MAEILVRDNRRVSPFLAQARHKLSYHFHLGHVGLEIIDALMVTCRSGAHPRMVFHLHALPHPRSLVTPTLVVVAVCLLPP